MKYTILNGTESQMLKLEKGDMIAAEIVSDSGTLDIIIQQDGEDPIYQGSTLLPGATAMKHPKHPESGKDGTI